MDTIFELPDRTFIGGKETALSLRYKLLSLSIINQKGNKILYVNKTI